MAVTAPLTRKHRLISLHGSVMLAVRTQQGVLVLTDKRRIDPVGVDDNATKVMSFGPRCMCTFVGHLAIRDQRGNELNFNPAFWASGFFTAIPYNHTEAQYMQLGEHLVDNWRRCLRMFPRIARDNYKTDLHFFYSSQEDDTCYIEKVTFRCEQDGSNPRFSFDPSAFQALINPPYLLVAGQDYLLKSFARMSDEALGSARFGDFVKRGIEPDTLPAEEALAHYRVIVDSISNGPKAPNGSATISTNVDVFLVDPEIGFSWIHQNASITHPGFTNSRIVNASPGTQRPYRE